MPHDIFISYSSKDRKVADAVCIALETQGINCWIAPRNILSGSDYSHAINEAIPDSSALLLIFSENSNKSKYVLNEVDLAMDLDIDIIPWRVEDTKPTGGMNFYLRRRQWLDALPAPIENHLDQLVIEVKRLLTLTGKSNSIELTPENSLVNVMSEAANTDVVTEETNTARKTNRAEFLAQCDEYDSKFFGELLDYCGANHRKITIEWGNKGFSLKDAKQRPLIWMFPTRPEWSVQIRTLKFTRPEIERVREVLYTASINGNSWKPRALSLSKTKDIVNLLCRIKPLEAVEVKPVSPILPPAMPPNFAELETQDAITDSEFQALERKITREEFLNRCDKSDRFFFEQVLDFCDRNRRKIIVDWGSKGFSLKDKKSRPLIWMFPTRGEQWTIQIRTLKYTARETNWVKDELRSLGIASNSWQPRDMPIEKILGIIALLCKTEPVTNGVNNS